MQQVVTKAQSKGQLAEVSQKPIPSEWLSVAIVPREVRLGMLDELKFLIRRLRHSCDSLAYTSKDMCAALLLLREVVEQGMSTSRMLKIIALAGCSVG